MIGLSMHTASNWSVRYICRIDWSLTSYRRHTVVFISLPRFPDVRKVTTITLINQLHLWAKGLTLGARDQSWWLPLRKLGTLKVSSPCETLVWQWIAHAPYLPDISMSCSDHNPSSLSPLSLEYWLQRQIQGWVPDVLPLSCRCRPCRPLQCRKDSLHSFICINFRFWIIHFMCSWRQHPTYRSNVINAAAADRLIGQYAEVYRLHTLLGNCLSLPSRV